MFKELPIAKCCDSVSKAGIYILVFLLPIFFLPWTSDVLDFNKQILLTGLVFVAFFAWIVKSLVLGTFSVNLNKTYIAVLILFLASLFSTIFSLDKYGSFWGWPRATSESLLTIISFVLLYFLVSNIFSKKEILKSVILLALSGLVAILIGVFHLLGWFVIPFSFTKIASFNTIGLVSSFGLFIAALLPLLIILEICAKKWLKAIFALGIILSVIALILINYSIVWWMVLISSVLTILLGMLKRELFDLRWLGLPIFFLVIALFFLVLKPQFGVAPRPIEVFLNQPTTLNIALQTLKQSPIFGSGPGTFIYDFSKYKKIDFNGGLLWNMRFDGGSSKILTILATTGILGFISLLALMASIIFYGIKFVFKQIQETKSDNYFWILAGGILIGFITQTIGYFLYNSNLSLDFVYFFLIACFIALVSEKKKDYSLGPSSFLTVGATFVFILFFIFGLWFLILDGQRYAAEISYSSGAKALAAGQMDQGMQKIERAVGINPKLDFYLTELSQVYLSKLGNEVNRQDLSQDAQKKNIQLLVNNSINAAKLATDVNPNNVNNWSVRGFVYRNLIGLLNGAEDWAIKSYDEAIKLEPNNPYYPNQKGIVFVVKASLAGNSADKKQIFAQAKEQFDKAVQLKSDYASARFQIAMLYQAEGKTDEAIKGLEETRNYAPSDVGLAFQLGLLYYQNKDFQKAQAELERAITISPNYANALYFLGLTYDELGQRNKAIEEFSKIAESNPNNADLKKILNNLKAGKDALQGISSEKPAEVPVK